MPGVLGFRETSSFNPRSRAGSDIARWCCTDSPRPLQSTLPRGERLRPALHAHGGQPASIHAPARGATRRLRRCAGREGASIHAPARGATISSRPRRSGKHCFNPRSRAGSDSFSSTARRRSLLLQSTLPRGERPIQAVYYVVELIASIHAPARGATLSWSSSGTLDVASIHAPARGATLPTLCLARPVCCFNPRSRAGSDTLLAWAFAGMCASIHAPARGATSSAIVVPTPEGRFNPRSRAGSD